MVQIVHIGRELLVVLNISKISTGVQILLEHSQDILKTVPEKYGFKTVHQKLFAFLLKMRKMERKNWKNMMVIKQRDRDLQDIAQCLALKGLLTDFVKALSNKEE